MKNRCGKCDTLSAPPSLRMRQRRARWRRTASAGLLAVLPLVAPSHARAAQTSARAQTAAFEVIYLEVPVPAAAATRTLLRRRAGDARAAAVRAAAANFHVEVLGEVGRPERWLVLQWADSQSQLQAIDAAVAPDLASLQGQLVAPPDQRRNEPLPATVGATAATAATGATGAIPVAAASAAAAPAAADRRSIAHRWPIPRAALYAVSHLDIGAQDQSAVIEALHDLLQAARRAPGNLLAEAWQQDGRANHYALLLVWQNRAHRDAFAGAAPEHRFRSVVGPLLGAPYDERLYRGEN